jgi:hypothetical protein
MLAGILEAAHTLLISLKKNKRPPAVFLEKD